MSPDRKGEPPPGVPIPLGKTNRALSGAAGVVLSAVGGVAVFITTNGVGAAAFVAVGAAFTFMAVSGYLVRFNLGGSGISTELMRDAETGRGVTVALEVAPEDPEASRALMAKVLEKSARAQGLDDPRATAKMLTGWPELQPLVDAVEADLSRIEGATVEQPTDETTPWLVATIKGKRYGLWVAGAENPSAQWVEDAINGAKNVGADVIPVLLIEHPPPEFLANAAKDKLNIVWRSRDGRFHNAPWER
jgi:hypothetical protein